MFMGSDNKTVVFFSSCLESWGGSEELWAQAAELLAERGYEIHIFKLSIDFEHPQIKRLLSLGCRITDLNEYLPSLGRRLWNRFLPHHSERTLPSYIKKVLGKRVDQLNPKLFVVSQGADFDGLPFIKRCPLERLPYVLIVQKAADELWANDEDRDWMKEIWQRAEKTFFVSRHNLRLTEEKFGMKFENSEVVSNPFLTRTREPLSWTFSPGERVRLACVGRLFPTEKGQDILMRVLSDKKWRERDLEVSFFGRGINEQGLKDLARFFGIHNVVFRGHVSDIDAIWKEHQALILPSRAEGLPLALIETMLCGRTAIVTKVGGNPEILDDNVTGFIAETADERSFDEAFERAWQRRGEWEQIGRLAAARVRALIPEDPARDFAEKLIALMDESGLPDSALTLEEAR